MVYDELRRMARHYMRGERDGHTLQTTALVNEVYLRLVDVAGVNWQDRTHFFAVSTQMMRRILVDAARARGSRKRGGATPRVNLDEIPDVGSGRANELVALDDSLNTLAEFDPRKAKVIERWSLVGWCPRRVWLRRKVVEDCPTIHPFLDGNGRVGRLLITLLMCEEKVLQRPLLYLSYFLKRNRTEYSRS